MADVKFDLKPVFEKPSRRYRKGSKYDPILDTFLNSSNNLVEVESDLDANYLKSMLNYRINKRDLENSVAISVVNNMAFLERKKRDKNPVKIKDDFLIINMFDMLPDNYYKVRYDKENLLVLKNEQGMIEIFEEVKPE